MNLTNLAGTNVLHQQFDASQRDVPDGSNPDGVNRGPDIADEHEVTNSDMATTGQKCQDGNVATELLDDEYMRLLRKYNRMNRVCEGLRLACERWEHLYGQMARDYEQSIRNYSLVLRENIKLQILLRVRDDRASH
jgi:hypothetical protein